MAGKKFKIDKTALKVLGLNSEEAEQARTTSEWERLIEDTFTEKKKKFYDEAASTIVGDSEKTAQLRGDLEHYQLGAKLPCTKSAGSWEMLLPQKTMQLKELQTFNTNATALKNKLPTFEKNADEQQDKKKGTAEEPASQTKSIDEQIQELERDFAIEKENLEKLQPDIKTWNSKLIREVQRLHDKLSQASLDFSIGQMVRSLMGQILLACFFSQKSMRSVAEDWYKESTEANRQFNAQEAKLLDITTKLNQLIEESPKNIKDYTAGDDDASTENDTGNMTFR